MERKPEEPLSLDEKPATTVGSVADFLDILTPGASGQPAEDDPSPTQED